ncbi:MULTISPECIES: 16S rRNA (uracil(1498)-N(3))-methyltransferase [Arthrobacter]|uniref:Ribosomal RNA small subunit methyltransferase E n=2 Tax=Arthrobacter TaxID=1663 RepID=A0ABU9KGI7_9MICC|nr:16S rRNA (uracil(1498)-N(3))-methyltransferase [Arthrobacter sp. YJM1]MDP5226016.1 16S rRNA (uracil(1498)-N(3))-methyltransferase [Arthrobacter sp. YJM1]
MSNPVFFATPEDLASAVPGGSVMLTGPEARHAATVKRLAAGEGVDLVDEHGTRVTGTVESAHGDELVVTVAHVHREPAPAPRIVLVQALAKGDRDEQAIESATELGVDGVLPWQADRSIVRWRGDRAAKALAKWRSVVRAAAKQSRRSRTPAVEDPVDTAGLVRRIARASHAYILHEDAAESLSLRLGDEVGGTEAQDAEILLIVGPEGGISPEEVSKFREAGAKTALLGPHVLRSSSAGPAAIVVASTVLGRW